MYTIKSKQTRIFKNFTVTKNKETRNNILFFLISTFDKNSLVILNNCNGPKVGINVLIISHVRILFLVSLLTFCSNDQSVLIF